MAHPHARLAVALALTMVLPGAASAASARRVPRLRPARAPASQLKRTDAIPLPGGATVYRFQQRVAGVPVLGGNAVLNEPPGAAPELVADATSPGIETPPPARVGERQAVGIASRSVGTTRALGPRSASLAIEPGGGGTLVWRVAIPSARPLGDFEVLVDAASGDVLRTRNLIKDFKRGSAKLYDPNPVVEHGGFNGLRSDHHDRDTSLLTSLRVRVKLKDIKGGQHCLRGRWAHVKLGHNAHEVCKRRMRFLRVTRSANRFEALMAYYHIDRSQRYIQSLGFSDASGDGIDDRPQIAVADQFSADDSYFLSSGRVIRYGSGGVDDAEDADVILHEYGHALQYSESPGFETSAKFEAGAIAEGSGDYWAAAMSARSPGTTNTDDVCIFDWDATTWGPVVPPFHRHCGRRADDQRTVQQASAGSCGNDIHCVGQVWSSALWDLRKELGDDAGGRSIVDRDYLASQFMYTKGESFGKAGKALLQADADLYGGADHAAICTEMASRGIAVVGCP